jgi:hypothetical protein
VVPFVFLVLPVTVLFALFPGFINFIRLIRSPRANAALETHRERESLISSLVDEYGPTIARWSLT